MTGADDCGDDPAGRPVHRATVMLALPELAAFVAPWRATAYATGGGAGGERRFPPHITLLAPFAGEGEQGSLQALDELAARHQPFDVRFSRVAQFPEGAVWLVPEPADAVSALMTDVRHTFADLPDDVPQTGLPKTDALPAPAPIPHVTVTVAAGPKTQGRVQAALDAQIRAQGPLVAPVRSLAVWRRDDAGVWRLSHRSPLGGARCR